MEVNKVKAIKSNMIDQIGTNNRSILHCTKCDGEYSANAGDYWDTPDNHVFKCCGRIMEIVTKHTVYR